jgi:hypothetical protein
MKPAIFLVEDIQDGQPITFYEKLFWKLKKKLESENKQLLWLSEVPRLLNSFGDQDIKFMSVYDFIKQPISNTDYDVFYYISCRHTLDMSGIQDFLAMDPDVLDYLEANKIPIILDTSCEVNDHYIAADCLFNGSEKIDHRHQLNHHVFRGLKNIEFYIIGSTQIPYGKKIVDGIDIKYNFFPSGFFFYNWRGGPYYTSLVDQRDQVVERIKNKKITEDTFIWEAWGREPRLIRSIFQLKAEHEGLTSIGRYSRLRPAKDRFFKELKRFANLNEFGHLDFMSDELIDSLDQIKILDNSIGWPTEDQNFVTGDSDVLFYVALETCQPLHHNDIINSTANLTEKCTIRITSGQPFIPMGGQHLGSILKDLGFKEYRMLEFPQIPHLLDEVNYVVDKIKTISKLSLEEKQALYEEWKDTLIYNLDHYINLNIPRAFLESVRDAK